MKLDEDEKMRKIETDRKRAELKSSLAQLEQEKELAAAEAEVGALKSAERESEQGEMVDDLPKERENATKRTEQYVKDHSYPIAYGQLPLNPTASPFHPYDYPIRDRNRSPELFCPLPQPGRFRTPEQEHEPPPDMNFQSPQNPATSELTKFLLRKDLLFARLTTFSEEPEAYLSWKRTFKQVMDELSVGPAEELELLIKW